MQKNVASQKFVVFAFNKTNNNPLTGDAANITANLQIDFATAAATNDVNPTELEDGYYSFDATQAETNGDVIVVYPASTTADIQVIGVPSVLYTTPSGFSDDVMRGTDSAYTGTPPTAAAIVNEWESQSQADPTGFHVNVLEVGGTTADIATETKQDAQDLIITETRLAELDAANIPADIDGITGLVGNLSTGSSAISKRADLGTVNVGTVIGGTTYTNTYTLDGIFHSITEDGSGNFDVQYDFNVGGNGVGVQVVMNGYFSGNGDELPVQAYNYVGAVWEQAQVLIAAPGTEVGEVIINLDVQHTGTGANAGDIQIRGKVTDGSLSSVQLNMDKVRADYTVISESVGYDNGSIWFDSNASNTGTVVRLDGTADNPVSTEAAVRSLLAAVGLHRIECAPGSTYTIGADLEGVSVAGNGSTLILNNKNIGGSVFRDFGSITGVGTTTGSPAFFEACLFGTCTLPPSTRHLCGYGGTLTMGSVGDYTCVDGYSTVAGAGSPVFTKTAGQVITAEFRRFSGGITSSGTETSDVLTIGGELGSVTLNGANGAVEIRNIYKTVTDNRTGGPTLNLDGAIKASDVASIQVDTNELQTNQGDWVTGNNAVVTKNSIFSNFPFPMVLTSDHYTAAITKTVTAEMRIDNAAYVAANGVISEVSDGLYEIDLTAADTNGDVITYKFSATDCDDTVITIITST